MVEQLVVHTQSTSTDHGRLQAGSSQSLLVSSAANWRQSRSKLFAIPAREGYLVFVTSEDQIREVENSAINHLSFHQAMEDVCPGRTVVAPSTSANPCVALETESNVHFRRIRDGAH